MMSPDATIVVQSSGRASIGRPVAGVVGAMIIVAIITETQA
jgi:hypothetical protein